MVSGGNRLEIFVYLDRAVPELERTIGQHSMVLGCIPLVNLFRSAASRSGHPYADRIPGRARCTATAFRGSLEHRAGAGNPAGRLDPAVAAVLPADGIGPGSQPRLADSTTRRGARRAGRARHRGLPRAARSRLRSGGRQPTPRCRSMRCASTATCRPTCPSAAAARICGWSRERHRSRRSPPVTAPTTTLRPPLRENGFWRLISHLSLGHLSVTGGTGGADALKEVLRLYAFRDTPETQRRSRP